MSASASRTSGVGKTHTALRPFARRGGARAHQLQPAPVRTPVQATPECGVLRALSRAPWIRRPGFTWGTHEGFRDYSFGARAGPEIGFQHLAHEMAHAIELLGNAELARLHANGYGLRVAQVEILGRSYDNPETMQATERECRVAGIQMHIMESAGLRVSSFIDDFAETMVQFMPDWFVGAKHSEARKHQREELIVKSYGSWDRNAVREAWSEVCAHIHRCAG